MKHLLLFCLATAVLCGQLSAIYRIKVNVAGVRP
jgi:hypothetical protein